MWWCCGKPSRDALGCKYYKHLSKDDDEEEILDLEDKEEKIKRSKC